MKQIKCHHEDTTGQIQTTGHLTRQRAWTPYKGGNMEEKGGNCLLLRPERRKNKCTT